MNSFTEEGMRLAEKMSLALAGKGPAYQKSAVADLRKHLQAMEDRVKELEKNGPVMRRGSRGDLTDWMGTMRDCLNDAREAAYVEARIRDESHARVKRLEDENKRLRNSYLELRSIFRANMLRAFAGKDVDAEIDKALEIPDRVIFPATPQEGSEAP